MYVNEEKEVELGRKAHSPSSTQHSQFEMKAEKLFRKMLEYSLRWSCTQQHGSTVFALMHGVRLGRAQRHGSEDLMAMLAQC